MFCGRGAKSSNSNITHYLLPYMFRLDTLKVTTNAPAVDLLRLNTLRGGRRGGPMVSEFDSGSSVPGSSPGRGHCVVLRSWARHSTPTVPLSTQVYKWVPANLMLGVTLRWTRIPSRGGVAIFLVA